MSKSFVFRFLRRPYIRFTLLSAIAATVAFLAGSANPAVDASVAALTALLSVRPTFHDTAAESFRQILGTAIGAVLGLGLVHLFGNSAGVMFVLVLVCFGLARVLRLGEDGAAVMGLTVILVLGPVSDIAKAETRFFGVLLGAAVALATSIWVRPGLPHERALHEALKHSDRSATVLTDMSEHLLAHQGSVNPQIGQAWVTLAEQIMTDLATVRVDAEAALASARWSPLVNRRDAENVLEQIRIAQINARTVYNMANDLFLASKQDRGLDEEIAGSIADVLSATADVISGQGTTARDNPGESLTDTDTTVMDLSSMREDAIDAMKDSDSTQPLLLAGSLLRDAEKISTAVVDGAPKVGGPARKANRRRNKRRK